MDKEKKQQEKSHWAPYSLSVKGAAEYFGFAEHTLYQWISDGRLIRGVHYRKAGRKVLIIREAMIDFIREEDERQDTHGYKPNRN